jgi:uncharacterized protein YpuA (DUF1002 family)
MFTAPLSGHKRVMSKNKTNQKREPESEVKKLSKVLSYDPKGNPKVKEVQERMIAAINLSLKNIKDKNDYQVAEDTLWRAIFNDKDQNVIKTAYAALGKEKTSGTDTMPFRRLIDDL